MRSAASPSSASVPGSGHAARRGPPARYPRGQFVDQRQPRDQCGRSRWARAAWASARSNSGIGGKRDSRRERVARRCWCARTAAPAETPGRFCSGVDLAEFDAPATDLHLVVGATGEDQSLRGRADQVAAAIGALPPRVGIGAYFWASFRVQVARQPDAADHELPGLAPADLGPFSSTTARSQPSSGKPMRTGGVPSSRAAAQATTVASVGP